MILQDARPRLCALIEKLLGEESLGEDFSYDIGPAMVMLPTGPIPGYLLMLSCRSPLLNPPMIIGPHFIGDGYPSEADLRTAIKEALKAMAELRLEMLKPAQ